MLVYGRQCFAAGGSDLVLPPAFLVCIAVAVSIRVAACMPNSMTANNNFSALSITQGREAELTQHNGSNQGAKIRARRHQVEVKGEG